MLKQPEKFLAKSVQKGIEVSWNRLNPEQRQAMSEAKQAEVQSWLSNKVVKWRHQHGFLASQNSSASTPSGRPTASRVGRGNVPDP